MHILLSSATPRAIFFHNTQLSRCFNFDLNSRRTLRRDGKLIERTVNTFPSAAFRVRRKARNRRWREESFTRWQCQYCYSRSRISYILILSRLSIVKKASFYFRLLYSSFFIHRASFQATRGRDSIFSTICYNFSFNSSSRISAL